MLLYPVVEIIKSIT